MGCAPLANDRLSQTHRNRIERRKHRVFFSPTRIRETRLLLEKNRLPVAEDPGGWIREALKALPVRDTGISFAITV